MDNCTYEYEDWKNWIGQRVCAKGTMIGTLRYFGETSFSRGIWCGIELDDSLGKNDGTVCGVKYFTCKFNYGIFVPVSKVKKLCENSDKIIEEIPYRANQNKTFEIKGSHTFSIETNKVDEELACNNAAVESIDKTKFNLSKSLMDSEESLGILRSEEFENSWDSLLPDCSLSNVFPSHQVDMNYIQDSDISQQCIAFEKENIFSDKVSYPKYASTPRQVMKTKSVGHVNDLKANLCLGIQEDADEVFSDVSVQNDSNIHFDFDKIKNNPNLSSTSKTQLNFDFQIHNDEQNLTATECKILMGNEEDNLNTTHTFSKHNMNPVMENDPLNKTFAVVTPDSCTSINEFKELQNKEIINKHVNENCDKKLNCTFNKEDLNLVKELNLNATYELKAPEFSSQNYLHEKTILADNLFDNLNTFNTSNSIDQNVADTESFDNVQIKKKSVSESCSVKDKLTSNLLNNKNSDFNQKVEIPDTVFDNVLLCEEPEAKIPSNSSNEQNTIKQGSCTSGKASKQNYFKKESFLSKNKFLKDEDKIEKPSRKSVSSHLNSRRSLAIPDSSGTLLLNSTFCLTNEKSNSKKVVSDRSRKRLSEAPTNKTSVHEKFNNFKKPFVPHSLVRPSKFASKSQPFMDSKGNLQNSSLEESCNSRNSCDKSNFALVKCNDKSLLDMKSKLPVNSRSLKLPVKTNAHLSHNLNDPKNGLNTIVLPLCKENKCTSQQLYSTHPGNTKSKFDSKGTLNSKNIYSKNRDIGSCREGNLLSNSKIVTQKSEHKVSKEHEQFKIPDLLKANKSKLPKRSQTVSLSTEDINPRRNTISSYPTESLPVGIVKPRSSLSKPIKFINNEKSVSQSKDISVAPDNIVDTKSKIKRGLGSRTIQVPRNFKTDTSKRNS